MRRPIQALAMLEEEAGNIEVARELFEKGSKADPKHLHIWQVGGAAEFLLVPCLLST